VAALIAFWSHALATAMFAGLVVWRLGVGARQPGQRMLLAAFAVTACWAWLNAVAAGDVLSSLAETARNLVWVGLLYHLSVSSEERQHGVRLVYTAVAAVLGLQFIADALAAGTGSDAVRQTALLLRITASAGALVLVHNLYGQAAPSSRSNIRFAMLGLALIWAYDLNLYTLAYLDRSGASALFDWRGLAVALSGPLFAIAATREEGWRVRLSRAATFQSLSLLAICAYFAVMAILATALRESGQNWVGALLVGVLTIMTLAAMILLPSPRARSWAKVVAAKHLFEHRYDYRTEWLRFTATLGHSGPCAPPLGERILKAFADILDAPGGLLLERDEAGSVSTAASWNWTGRTPPAAELEGSSDLWEKVESSGRVLDLDAYRHGVGGASDLVLMLPDWLVADPRLWAGIPLIHHERLVGIVLLAAPEYRRPLDWEDYDLMRTAGRQAASSLAEAHGRDALSNARRFEEFNRRFAFILHDIKNLVSQLSLLSRNAERHADNAEFRADMVATLKSSVGKMNELLARLSPQAGQRLQRVQPQPVRPILSAAIAAKRRSHDVRLLGDTSLWAVVDATALEDAVGHLIQNAIEASTADEPVTVRVTGRNDKVEIVISDKGCGMDADFVRNRLFQPFASTKNGGFGIGSFEARSLVTAMGGRVCVDSRPGQGTSFTILLAAADAPSETERKRA
jgi:putative PEP-CTERM system histidine kinase